MGGQELLLQGLGRGAGERMMHTDVRGTTLASSWQMLFEHLQWAKERATESTETQGPDPWSSLEQGD